MGCRSVLDASRVEKESMQKLDRYQQAVVEAVTSDRENLMVAAVAGSGKTTTLRHIVDHLPSDESVLILTFGKDIAAEWNELLRQHTHPAATAATVHSLCMRALKRLHPNVEVDAAKGKTIYSAALRQWLKSDGFRQARQNHFRFARGRARNFAQQMWMIEQKRIWSKMARACSLAKLTCPTNAADIEQMLETYELTSPVFPTKNMVQAIVSCLREAAAETRLVDYDDMLYLVRKHRIPLDRYDNVIVDEAQDLSPIQHWVLGQVTHEHSRLIGAGDPRQAIFNFAGADPESFNRLVKQFNCKVMPLSVSYRCPKNIARFLVETKLVEQLESAPDAPDGTVRQVKVSEMVGLTGALPGDFVLSRTNAPLLQLALHFSRLGWKVCVAGKSIERDCEQMFAESGADTTLKLISWLTGPAVAKRKLLEQQDGQAAAKFEDARQVVCALAQEASAEGDSLESMLTRAQEMTAPDGRLPADAIVFSSTHKAKGLERNRVWVLDWTYKGTTPEERNLRYVAYTRARRDLFIVQEPIKNDPVLMSGYGELLSVDTSKVLQEDE